MIIARPTASEERWLVLADRYAGLRALVARAGKSGGWKTSTWLGRCLGFVLGLIGSGLLGGTLAVFPQPLFVGGLLLMVAAEWLVARRRVFRSGIEEAVYLCGAVAVTVQLLMWSDGSNDALGVALIATAVLLVGWRLLNPLFTTAAAVLYVFAIAMVNASLLGGHMNTTAAAMASIAVAVGALIASGHAWRRPSHDRMFEGLVIVMPWCAYAWLVAYSWDGQSMDRSVALLVAAVFFAATLLAGVKRGQHAALIGALGNLLCMGHALHRLLPWPDHWQLMVAGAVVLVVALVLERRLRRGGRVTSAAIDEPAGLDIAQLAGAMSVTPAHAATPEGVHGQGGSFGGGGASGRF
jgi:hypothetical protein